MRNRLIITVSTIHGTRHFDLHRLVIWILLSLIIVIGAVFASGSSFIRLLEEEVEVLQGEKQQLADSSQKLTEKNQILKVSINTKSEELNILTRQLNGLEEALQIEVDHEVNQSLQERLDIANLTLHQKKLMLSMVPSGIPMKFSRISSPFGRRVHPITKKRDSHKGIDLRAQTGTPIYATADGVIEFARSNYDKGYGNMVMIAHSFGFLTTYAHMSKLAVKRGQYVRQGELIGYCGNSGDSTASHLHYEVRYLRAARDPKPFMDWDLYSYDSLFSEVSNIPWGSFQQSVNRISELPVPLLSRLAVASKEVSN